MSPDMPQFRGKKWHFRCDNSPEWTLCGIRNPRMSVAVTAHGVVDCKVCTRRVEKVRAQRLAYLLDQREHLLTQVANLSAEIKSFR